MKGFVFVMRRPRVYRFAGWAGKVAHVLTKPIHGTRLDPFYAWMTTADLLAFVSGFFDSWDEARADHLIKFLELPRDRQVHDRFLLYYHF